MHACVVPERAAWVAMRCMGHHAMRVVVSAHCFAGGPCGQVELTPMKEQVDSFRTFLPVQNALIVSLVIAGCVLKPALRHLFSVRPASTAMTGRPTTSSLSVRVRSLRLSCSWTVMFAYLQRAQARSRASEAALARSLAKSVDGMQARCRREMFVASLQRSSVAAQIVNDARHTPYRRRRR